MAQSDEDIPFDLKGPSRIIYALKPYYKGEEARQALEEVLSQYSPHAPSGHPTF